MRECAFFYLREIEVFPEAERQQLIAQQLIARHQTDAGTRTWQHEIGEQYLNSNQNALVARNLGALWSCIFLNVIVFFFSFFLSKVLFITHSYQPNRWSPQP